MNKDVIYSNIFNLINGGFFEDKYIELTKNIRLEDENDIETTKILEEKAAGLFNAILIGSQLIDDESEIKRFVDMFGDYIDPFGLLMNLHEFDLDDIVALNRLKHGFGVHFTTPKIVDIIKRQGVLYGSGKNALLSEDEIKLIQEASKEQQENDPSSIEKMNYLQTGFGVGVSSYSSMTNYFWMYHTPESLSFLFGDISKRDKQRAMKYTYECTSALDEKKQSEVREKLSDIYDRLVGDEQSVGCILIDRDALEYEKTTSYYYEEPTQREIRPYCNNMYSLQDSDSKITNDVSTSNLKFIKIPTIKKLEQIKSKQLQNSEGRSK